MYNAFFLSTILWRSLRLSFPLSSLSFAVIRPSIVVLFQDCFVLSMLRIDIKSRWCNASIQPDIRLAPGTQPPPQPWHSFLIGGFSELIYPTGTLPDLLCQSQVATWPPTAHLSSHSEVWSQPQECGLAVSTCNLSWTNRVLLSSGLPMRLTCLVRWLEALWNNSLGHCCHLIVHFNCLQFLILGVVFIQLGGT